MRNYMQWRIQVGDWAPPPTYQNYCHWLLPPVYVVRREGNVLTRVCPSVCPQGGGYPYPIQLCNITQNAMGPWPGGVTLAGEGYPGWGGTQLGQHREYLLHGGRYASCVHAGGLSCVNTWGQHPPVYWLAPSLVTSTGSATDMLIIFKFITKGNLWGEFFAARHSQINSVLQKVGKSNKNVRKFWIFCWMKNGNAYFRISASYLTAKETVRGNRVLL